MDDTPIKTWSFSKLKKFEKCPYCVYLKEVKQFTVKDPDPDIIDAAARGRRIHNEAENYVRGSCDTLPKSLKKFRADFVFLKQQFDNGNVELEENWGFDRNWTITDWIDENVWARLKADAVLHFDITAASIIDYKTGRKQGNEVSHNQQGSLYGVGLMLRQPNLECIDVDFWYLDEGKRTHKSYTRSQLLPIMVKFEARAKRMTEATTFKPKPNKYNCMWCDYGPSNGTGDCAYGVE